MAEELDLAAIQLNHALNRYNSVCTRLRKHYVLGRDFPIGNSPELTDRIIQELSQVSSYEIEIQHSKAFFRQIQNFSGFGTPGFINRFPTEILTRIFEDVLNAHPCPALDYRLKTPSKTTFLKDPVILSHVCSHWRRIVINTANLWSHIDINPAEINLPKTSARLAVYMGRSANTSLDFHIAQTSRSRYKPYLVPSDTSTTITDLLALAAPRIQNLTLSIPGSYKQIYRSFLATCFSDCTPGTLARISLRAAELDCNHIGPYLVKTSDWLPGRDWLMGLPSETVEAVWDAVKILQLKAFRPEWTSKAYHGLTELRLVKVGVVSQFELGSIFHSSPELRVLELDLELQNYTLDIDSNAVARLNNLEILILGGSRQKQIAPILQLIAPGSKSLSLSLVNPYIGSRDFSSKDELTKFAARSNITRLCAHEFHDPAQLAEVLNLMPDVRVVAIASLTSGSIDEENYDLDLTIELLYVITSSSRFNRFTWSQLEMFVERHRVQKLVLWRYDFRYCGLSDPGRDTVPPNLYTICPVVRVVPHVEPNPIMEWFGE